MKKEDGSRVVKFEGISNLGVSYFHSLYYESNKINIVEIMKISSYFQRLVTD